MSNEDCVRFGASSSADAEKVVQDDPPAPVHADAGDPSGDPSRSVQHDPSVPVLGAVEEVVQHSPAPPVDDPLAPRIVSPARPEKRKYFSVFLEIFLFSGNTHKFISVLFFFNFRRQVSITSTHRCSRLSLFR